MVWWINAAWLLAAVTQPVSAASDDNDDEEGITCYGYGGIRNYTENSLCPGSDACCGVGATCLSNRLCHNKGDDPWVFVRGPCFVQPWDKSRCAQVCLEDDTGRLPRVHTCIDGSLCCASSEDDDCCKGGDTFFLDNEGNVVDSAPSTTYSYGPERTASTYVATLPSTTTTQSTSSSSPATTSTSSPGSATTSTTPEDQTGNGDEGGSSDGGGGGGGNDNAVKIGAGVGVPVSVLLIAAVALFFFMRRRKARKQGSDQEFGESKHGVLNRKQPHGDRSELVGSIPPVELDASQPATVTPEHSDSPVAPRQFRRELS